MFSTDAWKVIVNVISMIIAAVAVGIGVWQYVDESKLNREAAVRRNVVEFNRALWEEEFKTYRDISTAVGNLVAAIEMRDDGAHQEAEKTFRALYWGRAVFVENDSIETQMVTFRQRINQYAEKRLTNDQLKKAAEILSDKLKNAARAGADAARQGAELYGSTP